MSIYQLTFSFAKKKNVEEFKVPRTHRFVYGWIMEKQQKQKLPSLVSSSTLSSPSLPSLEQNKITENELKRESQEEAPALVWDQNPNRSLLL